MVDQSQVDAVSGVKGIEGEDVSPRSVDAGEVLRAPVYSDNANALQQEESLWYNDGSGPNAAGYYGYDGSGIIGPFGDVHNPVTQDLDLGGHAITNAAGIDTGGATINNQSVSGVWADSGATITEDKSNDVIRIENLPGSAPERYRLYYDFGNTGVAGAYTARLNGDAAGNANYHYYDETGTLTTGADGVLLFDSGTATAPHVGGDAIFAHGGAWAGINHRFVPARAGVVNSFSQAGGRNGSSGQITSIEIHIPGDVGNWSQVDVRLFAKEASV